MDAQNESLKEGISYRTEIEGQTPKRNRFYWILRLVIALILSIFCIITIDFFTSLQPTYELATKIIGIVGIWFSIFLEFLYFYSGIKEINPRYSIQLTVASIAFLIILLLLAKIPGPEEMSYLVSSPLDMRIIVILVVFGLYLLAEVEIYTLLLSKKRKRYS